jgi:hypothetical protein
MVVCDLKGSLYHGQPAYIIINAGEGCVPVVNAGYNQNNINKLKRDR